MVQYDLHIIQNIAAAGIEFSEKPITIVRGGIFTASADANRNPRWLSGGTENQIPKIDANGDLVFADPAAGHTQNTDTGTTSNTFEVSSDGVAGSILIDGAQAGGDFETKIVNTTQAGNIVLTLPAVTGTFATEAYASGLFAANDAMIYKGTVGAGGTIEKAALEALATYNAGWTYRIITAGTYFGVVAEVGDLITAIVDRTGSGDIDADWTVVQTNLDGAVIGPASVTDGYLVQFDGTTGKLIKAGTGVPGTMAYETATNYVAKALFDANTVLFATSDNTPVALLGTELPPKIWAAVPADKIGTGWTGTAISGQIARDANWFYMCVTGGTATNQVWTRSAMATNWP